MSPLQHTTQEQQVTFHVGKLDSSTTGSSDYKWQERMLDIKLILTLWTSILLWLSVFVFSAVELRAECIHSWLGRARFCFLLRFLCSPLYFLRLLLDLQTLYDHICKDEEMTQTAMTYACNTLKGAVLDHGVEIM